MTNGSDINKRANTDPAFRDQGPEVQTDSEIISNELTDTALDKVSGGKITDQGGRTEARVLPYVEQDN